MLNTICVIATKKRVRLLHRVEDSPSSPELRKRRPRRKVVYVSHEASGFLPQDLMLNLLVYADIISPQYVLIFVVTFY